jgi:hypothetical protein
VRPIYGGPPPPTHKTTNTPICFTLPTNYRKAVSACVLDIPEGGTVLPRETGEGWPLLNVETVANGDSWSTNDKGSFLGGFVGLEPVQEIFILPWLLWSAQYKYFFPHCILFHFTFPHCPETWAGSRAGPPVTYNVSLLLPLVQTKRFLLFLNERK